MSFQENLIRARKARGMTQEELAARLSISRQAVSKWETESLPDLYKLAALADELGVSTTSCAAAKRLYAARYPQRLSRGCCREKPLRRRSGGSQSRTDLCAAS